MRILLLVDCYLPSPKSSAKLIHDLGVELRDQGHEVIVAAPDASLPPARRVTEEDGIRVLRIRTGLIKGAGMVFRAINEARLSAVMWRQGRDFFRDTPCDLVVYYSPTIFFGRLVGRLKKLWGCRSYLILRDIFPQWAVDAHVLRKGSLPYRYFRRKETEQYEVADVIGVQSPANLRYFEERGLADRYRLEVLYHWAPASHGELPETNFRRELGLDGKVVFFYGGNIGVAQDMDNVVRLAERLRDEQDIHFLILGEGSEVPRLQQLIESKALTNISIHGPLDQKRYLAALSEFDIGLITLARGLKTQNFPGKMLGYMYFAMPILASINPENDLQQLLEDHGAGLTCINGDDDKFREFALKLARDPELRRRIGENGRKLLRTFSSERAATQILSHVATAS
jgi:glycosyltransferase involved in cell wall biosynthesis